MKVVIKTTNIELNQALQDFVQEKFDDLERFARVFQRPNYFNGFWSKGKPRVEAWVEIGRTTRHHNKGPFFRAEGQMRFPGKSVRAEACSEDLRIAIAEVKDELQRQLKQYKEKATAKEERGWRKLKRLFRFASGAGIEEEKGQRIREEGR